MSSTQLEVPRSLFQNLGAIAPKLFASTGNFRLFSNRVLPTLNTWRERLREAYDWENSRQEIEPVMLLGVLMFQFLERVPDRQAVETVKYHLGRICRWNVRLSEDGFHPMTLPRFRSRLADDSRAAIVFRRVLEALPVQSLNAGGAKQRLDPELVLATLTALSALERIRELLGSALEEITPQIEPWERTEFWSSMWEVYIETVPDYKANREVLRREHYRAGQDCQWLLRWSGVMRSEIRYAPSLRRLRAEFFLQFGRKEKSS
jgi:hypothetical protein